MSWKIPLFDLDYDDRELVAVQQVIQSRWLSMGEMSQKFEKAFAEKIGVKYAFAVSNGTVALHLACLALEIKRGSEVIVPGLTFVATAAAVRYVGANPVFADIVGPQDLTISPESIEAQITPHTRAIIVMHYAGYACNMEAIRGIANKHGLKLIEDAAHAPGAEYGGVKLGAWGDTAAFSFFSNKNMATGEGGMVVTNSEEVADFISRSRSHGMSTISWDRYRGQALSYDVTMLGYNYRPNEIMAALGLVQLSKLDKNNEKRRVLSEYYRELLSAEVPELILPFSNHPGIAAAHIMPILLPEYVDRNHFMMTLKTLGIQTSIHYPIIQDFKAYRMSQKRTGKDAIPLIREWAPREVTLPLYSSMNTGDIEQVVHAVKTIMHSTKLN